MQSFQAHSTHIARAQCKITSTRSRTSLKVSAKAAKKPASQKAVTYGADWYEATRQASRPKRTVREEIAFRKEANRLANNGKERKDLYTDNWDGSEYKGSKFNILTVIALVSVLTPLLGLVFAYTTFGVLWG